MRTSDKFASLTIRVASVSEFERVSAFYINTAYAQPIDPADKILFAEREGEICAVLRLCSEKGTLVLRGMRVQSELRRRGIGSHLLREAAKVIGERECFCIPHAYLRSFYGQIDFQEVGPNWAPAFLHERLVTYRQLLGLDVILMRRPGTFSSNDIVDGCE